MLDLSSFFTTLSSLSSTPKSPTEKENFNDADDKEVLLCPSSVSEACSPKNVNEFFCTANANEIFVNKYIGCPSMSTTPTSKDGFASNYSFQSDTSSVVRQPRIWECLSDPEDIPTEISFYRRKRDWDLPRNIAMNWHRETNVKHFFGIHKWMGQLCYTVGSNKVVIGTIVCYELQPLSSARKSGHGAVLLRSVDASLHKLSLLVASSTLQSQTLWSEHWENLPLMLICNVYVAPPYRGLGLGLALIDDACRKPGRDIPWILTATSNPSLQDYFGLLGFHPQIFGDSFGARWNDLDRNRLPKIDDICPHFPPSSLLLSQQETPATHCQQHSEYNEEDDLFVQDEVVLTSFQPTTETSSSRSNRRRRRRLW